MGQSLLKNYSVDKDSYMSAGYNCLWRVHIGRSKLKEGDLASVFVFEKKRLDKFKEKEKEEILSLLRKEANFLLKFRHPGLLSVNESLLEDKNSLVFATEYVPYSMTTLLEKLQPTILEMKMQMIEVVDTLVFLHEDAKVIHSYLHPDGMFVDEKGKIKISSFCFAITDPTLMGNTAPLFNLNMVEAPNANFLAPEAVLNNKISYKSDVYALGVVISYLIKKIKNYTINLTNNSLDAYTRNLGNSNTFYDKFFAGLTAKLESVEIQLLQNTMNYTTEQRISAKVLKDQPWFNDPIITAVRFIENIETNDSNKNSLFFSQFPKILEKFEEKTIIKKILPKFQDLLKIETFTNSALPGLFTIAEKLSPLPVLAKDSKDGKVSQKSFLDFESIIWPSIKDLFKMKQMSAATLYFLISKIDYISKKIPSSEFSEHMLKIICKALDSNLQKLQKGVFEKLDVITKVLESQVFKNHIYERMISIVASTQHYEVKIVVLNAMKDTYRLLDQNTINDSFLGALEKVRRGDNKSEVCLKLVGIYQEISKIVNVKSIASKILPNLIGILTIGELSKKDFEVIMRLIHEYLNEIQEMRRKELEELENSKQLSSNEGNLFDPKPVSNTGNSKKEDEMFMEFMGGGNSNSGSSGSNQGNSSNSNNNTNNNADPFETLFSDFNIKRPTNTALPVTTSNNSNNNTNFYNDLDTKPPKVNDNLFNPVSKPNNSNINKNNDPFNFDIKTTSTIPTNTTITTNNSNKVNNKNNDPFNFSMGTTNTTTSNSTINKPNNSNNNNTNKNNTLDLANLLMDSNTTTTTNTKNFNNSALNSTYNNNAINMNINTVNMTNNSQKNTMNNVNIINDYPIPGNKPVTSNYDGLFDFGNTSTNNTVNTNNNNNNYSYNNSVNTMNTMSNNNMYSQGNKPGTTSSNSNNPFDFEDLSYLDTSKKQSTNNNSISSNKNNNNNVNNMNFNFKMPNNTVNSSNSNNNSKFDMNLNNKGGINSNNNRNSMGMGMNDKGNVNNFDFDFSTGNSNTNNNNNNNKSKPKQTLDDLLNF